MRGLGFRVLQFRDTLVEHAVLAGCERNSDEKIYIVLRVHDETGNFRLTDF